MFQTKVNPNFVAQMEAKDFQTQWMESEIAQIQNKINNFKQVNVSLVTDIEPMLSNVTKIIDSLRSDILEPSNYEKVFNLVAGFLDGHILQLFKQITKSEGKSKDALITTHNLYLKCLMLPDVVPRLYITTIAETVILGQLDRYRTKLIDNDEYAEILKQRNAPHSLSKIRHFKKQILENLNYLTNGIQTPIVHIFFRQYMFTSFQQFLDLEKTADSPASTKDYQVCSNFMLRNYVEANRLWCRTAYEVGRTKNEIAKRDRKRKYLGELIANGFMMLAKYTMEDEDRGKILLEVLREIKECGDAMAASSILEQVSANLTTQKVVSNMDQILQPICSFPTGLKTFLNICSKLQQENEITENNFQILCRHGTALARVLANVAETEGNEELQRVIGLNGVIESPVRSPWLAVFHKMVTISVAMWPSDLQKLAQILECVVYVIYPEIKGNIAQTSQKINANALVQYNPVVKDETSDLDDEEEDLKIKEKVTAKKSQVKQKKIIDSSSEESSSDSSEPKTKKRGKAVQKPEKSENSDSDGGFERKALSNEDESCLVQVFSAPYDGLERQLINDYLQLCPVIIARSHFTRAFDTEFCIHIAIALIKNPLTVDHDIYLQQREQLEKDCNNITEAVLLIANDRPFEFAQSLHCTHNAIIVFQQLQQIKASKESFSQFIPALFHSLVRDGFIHEALQCIARMEEGNPVGAIYCFTQCLTLISQIVNKTFQSLQEFSNDDLFSCAQKLIYAYESVQKSIDQPQILVYAMSMLTNCTIPESESLCVLKRFRAACANLLKREERCVCLAWCAKLYNSLGFEEESAEILEESKQASEKWATNLEKQKLQLINE